MIQASITNAFWNILSFTCSIGNYGNNVSIKNADWRLVMYHFIIKDM